MPARPIATAFSIEHAGYLNAGHKAGALLQRKMLAVAWDGSL